MIKKIRGGKKITRINAGGPGSGRYPAGSGKEGGDSGRTQSVSEKFAHKTAQDAANENKTDVYAFKKPSGVWDYGTEMFMRKSYGTEGVKHSPVKTNRAEKIERAKHENELTPPPSNTKGDTARNQKNPTFISNVFNRRMAPYDKPNDK